MNLWLVIIVFLGLFVAIFSQKLETIWEENELDYDLKNSKRPPSNSPVLRNRLGQKYTFDRWSGFPRRNRIPKTDSNIMVYNLNDKKARSKRFTFGLGLKKWWDKNKREIMFGHAFGGQGYGIPGK